MSINSHINSRINSTAAAVMLVATLLVTLNIADGYVPMASQSFRTERAGRSAFLRPSSSSLSSTWLQAATMPEGATSGATTDSKIGVLFLNLGGPEKSTDVEGFLYNLFADPDIIRLPPFISGLQKPIALAISKRRAPKSREAYNSIGGGSPIVKYTTEQANLISQALASNHNLAVKTYIGMRYWFPFTEQALAEIAEDGIQSLVILPLYPQFSVSTSGSSLRLLQEEFSKEESVVPKSMKHTVVASWYDRPGYVSSVAGLIMQELESFTEEEVRIGAVH